MFLVPQVVVKAARLSKRELEQVNNCKTCRPRRRGGDEPLEEVKAMAYLGQKAANHCIAPLLDSFLDKEGWLYIVQPFYARYGCTWKGKKKNYDPIQLI